MGKYQLPHYDRVHPSVRVGLRAGALVRQTMIARHGRDVPMDHDDLVRAAQKPAPPTLGDWANIPEAHYRTYIEEFLAGGSIPAASDPATANFLAAEMTACHMYDLYGRQVYTLSPLVHEMFDNTDLGALTLADANMPFPCFYVSLLKHRLGIDGFYVYRTADEIVFVAVGFGATGPWPDAKPCINEVWPAGVIDGMHEAEQRERGSYFRFFFEIGLDSFSRDVPVGGILDVILTGGAVRGQWQQHVDDEHMEHVARQTKMMVMTFFNLLFFLNSDDRSVLTHDDRDEKAEAEATVEKLSGKRGPRKRKRKRDAKQRLKYLSTARFHRVGVAQERDITSREGFDLDQPRHWRRGHFHRYWTGPLKLGGVKIPFDEWPDKRTIVRQWLIPTLINPEGERVDVTTRTVVKESQEALADEVLTEGKLKDHKQSKRERSPAARRKCLEHHGRICQLCFDDGSRFGEGAKGWLHVHHLDPLGDVVAEREVDPIADLVPVCGTCHGFLHSKRPPITMERAREIIETAKAEKAAK